MGMLSPISETSRGLKTYIEGVKWFKSHPKYLLFVFVPMVLGLVFLTIGWGFFFSYQDLIFQWAMFDRPDAWWMLIFFYIVKSLLYVAFFLLSILSSVLLVNVFASPVYEYVSMAVESDLTGSPAPELKLWESFLLIGEELKKVLFILTISIILLFIPGLNVVSTLVTAFLIGWDFYDYPLARRGWGFRQRFQFVQKDIWSVLGLGLWLVIPFVQFVLMPLAVAGGTMLAIGALQKQEGGQTYEKR